MLRMGRIFPFLTTTARGFARKPATGGVSKGPATNPFFTHVAIVSVSRAPFSAADSEFGQLIGGNLLFWYESAPQARSASNLLALLYSVPDILFLALSTLSARLAMFTRVVAFSGNSLLGNLLQNNSFALPE